MNVALSNMTNKEYEVCIEVSTKQQALDRCTISKKDFDVEYDNLIEMTKVLLPNQLNTKGHYFYSINSTDENNIGYIWCGILPGLPQDSIFLMDIHLLDEHRSKGIGRVALNSMHQEMKKNGFNAIYLNVLNTNFAKKLYLSEGYTIAEENENAATLAFNIK